MNSSKHQNIDELITSIQKKWGTKAAQYVPTGFESLDTLLGGGVQRGRLTHLMGRATSGMSTLALSVVAAVQRQGEIAVYIDLALAFDGDYAIECGVKPAEMLVIRPTFETALAFLGDLVMSRIPGSVVLNATPHLSTQQRKQLAKGIERLHPSLTQSNCVLLLLTPPLNDPFLSQYTSVRLLIELRDWLTEGGVTQGYQAQVTLLKHKGANEGKTATIAVQTGQEA